MRYESWKLGCDNNVMPSDGWTEAKVGVDRMVIIDGKLKLDVWNYDAFAQIENLTSHF